MSVLKLANKNAVKIALTERIAIALEWGVPAASALFLSLNDDAIKKEFAPGTAEEVKKSLMDGATIASALAPLNIYSEYDLAVITAAYNSNSGSKGFSQIANLHSPSSCKKTA